MMSLAINISAIIAVAFLQLFLGITGAPRSVLLQEPGQRLCSGKLLYFNQTQKCYVKGSRGPCNKTMTIQPISEENERLGMCACKAHDSCFPRPNVFWREENRCYWLFDQGPCPKGQWLTVNDNREPTCETIPCPALYKAQFDDPHNIPAYFIFSQNDTCYMNRQRTDLCPENEIFIFDNISLKPKCVGHVCGAALIKDENNCADGTEAHSTGGCEPIVELYKLSL